MPRCRVSSGLRDRIVTALIIAVVVIGVLTCLPAWVALPVIAAVFLAGAWEWAGFAGMSSAADNTATRKLDLRINGFSVEICGSTRPAQLAPPAARPSCR